jgi:hypothetical protein
MINEEKMLDRSRNYVNTIFRLLIVAVGIFLFTCQVIYASDKYHHGGGGIKKLNYDSLFNEAVDLSDSQAGQELLSNCFAAYGGEEALNKIKSIRYHWKMQPLMAADSSDIEKIAMHPRKYRIIHTHSGGDKEIRIINGDEGWYSRADTTTVIDRGRYKSELFSYLTLSMPLALKNEHFSEIKYGTREGDSLEYIYALKTDSVMIILGIDKDDYFIKKSEGQIYQDDSKFVFINHFNNYREYDGYFFPERSSNVSMGLTVGESILIGIEINIDLPESKFLPMIKEEMQ